MQYTKQTRNRSHTPMLRVKETKIHTTQKTLQNTQHTSQIAANPHETYRKNTAMKNLKKTHQTYYFIYNSFYCKIAPEAQTKQTNPF
jgi:hypothetical protein